MKQGRFSINATMVFAAIVLGIILMSGIAGALQTDTGFVYPTGVKEPYLYSGWLEVYPAYPFEGYYHIGQDMESAVGTQVYAIADGEIIRVSDGSAWNAVAADKNYGIFVKHKLNDGKDFVALYGHVRPIDVGLMRNGIIDPPVKVYSGVAFATVGPFSTTPPIPHLHFGIYPGLDYPLSNWGRMPISQPGANGFRDPIDWIKTKQPLQYLGAHIVTQSVYCKGQPCSTTPVMPGDELTFVYSINNPTTSDISNVRLGAQIRTNKPQGVWQDDNIRDQVVTVTPGTKDYSRKFIIPTGATPGFYDIRGVILNHGTGVWIDSKEMDRVLKVKNPESKPQPSLTLLYPAGGENWIAGTTQTVRWKYTGGIGYYLSIDILKKGKVVGGVDTYTNLRHTELTVPESPGNDYQIRITSIDKPQYTDKSKPFSVIVRPSKPILTFSKTFGASGQDQGMTAKQTSDGGYILVGQVNTGFGDGNADALLIKTNKYGTKQWQYAFGGSGNDYAYSVAETSDKGYIFVGSTQSISGPGKEKGWIVKINKDGTKDWEKGLVGPNASDYTINGFKIIEPASDGGFILAGYTSSHDASYYRTNLQAWLVKLDKDGNEIWSKGYGSNGYYDYSGVSAKEAPDGSYLMAVRSGHPVFWVVKVGSDGKVIIWKEFRQSAMDYIATDITPTSNEGYAVLGYQRPAGENAKSWLTKIAPDGNTAWHKTYEEANNHIIMNSFEQTKDGYIMAGSKFGGSGQNGLAIKTNADGIETDRKASSETNQNLFQSIKMTDDGGYILAGSIRPSETGKDDIWLVKIDGSVNI